MAELHEAFPAGPAPAALIARIAAIEVNQKRQRRRALRWQVPTSLIAVAMIGTLGWVATQIKSERVHTIEFYRPKHGELHFVSETWTRDGLVRIKSPKLRGSDGSISMVAMVVRGEKIYWFDDERREISVSRSMSSNGLMQSWHKITDFLSFREKFQNAMAKKSSRNGNSIEPEFAWIGKRKVRVKTDRPITDGKPSHFFTRGYFDLTNNKLVRQDHLFEEPSGEKGRMKDTVYSRADYDYDTPMPDSLFDVTPPPGWKVIDRTLR